MSVEKVLCVDPGVNTGWAYWERFRTDLNDWAPTATGVFRAGVNPSTEKRLKILNGSFVDVVRTTGAVFVYLESSGYWDQSARSRKSVASGSLVLLTMIVGGYVALSPSVHLVSPSRWKGSLSVDQLKRRIRRAIPGANYREHEREAVGIGLAVRGIL